VNHSNVPSYHIVALFIYVLTIAHKNEEHNACNVKIHANGGLQEWKSLIADLKEFNEVNNLILDER